ncbi:MAG: hypothetical protein NTW44_00990 [Nitrospirae bacterium]|nr:hypothetical protein [Nitrospirota bacterium]
MKKSRYSEEQIIGIQLIIWWAMGGLNPRPLPCEGILLAVVRL